MAITVEEADNIILANLRQWGSEIVNFEASCGSILAENIVAERDIPAFNRVAMDGIAINSNGFKDANRRFRIIGIQAAGDEPFILENQEDCVEIMTGAALPEHADTIIRYEDIVVEEGFAVVQLENIRPGKNVHFKGQDKKRGDVVLNKNTKITAACVGVLAAVGNTHVRVKKLPKTVIIATGNELVPVSETPSPTRLRMSNSYVIQAALAKYKIQPDLLHITDDVEITQKVLSETLLQYDLIIITGGVSAGKFDYIPEVLKNLDVNIHFHKIFQRPGKPMLFGTTGNTTVFAFPGNPVSAFLCLNRYLLPWLEKSLELVPKRNYAVLSTDVPALPGLTHFVQVQLETNNMGVNIAYPIQGNGSGDFSNLPNASAFIELPAGIGSYSSGQCFLIIKFS
jgi:molybdopterin molybdotransferase